MNQWNAEPFHQWWQLQLAWEALRSWARRPRAPAPERSADPPAATPPALSEWELQKRFNRFHRKAARFGVQLRRVGRTR
jgi:hypothetical protein